MCNEKRPGPPATRYVPVGEKRKQTVALMTMLVAVYTPSSPTMQPAAAGELRGPTWRRPGRTLREREGPGAAVGDGNKEGGEKPPVVRRRVKPNGKLSPRRLGSLGLLSRHGTDRAAYEQRTRIVRSPGSREPKIKASVASAPGGACLLAHTWPFSLGPHRRRSEELFGVRLRTLVLFLRPPLACPGHFPKSLHPDTIPLGISRMAFEGAQALSRQRPPSADEWGNSVRKARVIKSAWSLRAVTVDRRPEDQRFPARR